MDISIFSSINYLAVLVAGCAYFMVGSVWFSGLFGQAWAQELQKHGIKLTLPTPRGILCKMAQTLTTNMVSAYALACLFKLANVTDVASGIFVGLIVALGIAATTLATTYVWENRSLKLSLIDIGYPVFGILISSLMLSAWL